MACAGTSIRGSRNGLWEYPRPVTNCGGAAQRGFTPIDDPDGSVRRARRLRTVERAAIQAPIRRPVALRRAEGVRAQLLHEGRCGLVGCGITAVLDEHDHAEDSRHARPLPGLRLPARVAEIGRDVGAGRRSVGDLIDDEDGGFGAGIFAQALDDQRCRLVAAGCGGFRRIRLGRLLRRLRRWLRRLRRLLGGLPHLLPQLRKPLPDLRGIELQRPLLCGGVRGLAVRTRRALVGFAGGLARAPPRARAPRRLPARPSRPARAPPSPAVRAPPLAAGPWRLPARASTPARVPWRHPARAAREWPSAPLYPSSTACSCARTAPLNRNDSHVVMPSAATAMTVAMRLTITALSMNAAHPRS